MVKALEVIARRQGLTTTYEDLSEKARLKRSDQQNSARKKHYFEKDEDDQDGPPDTKRKFQAGALITNSQTKHYNDCY